MRYRHFLPACAACLALSLLPAFADQVVYFVNGKAIIVKSVEKGDKFTVLEIEGGGKMGVPTDQINRIEDYAISAPGDAAAAVAPAPVAPQPPAQRPMMQASPAAALISSTQASAPPPPATNVPGPGIGGRPAGGPNQNLAAIQPLNVGDAGPAAPPLRPQIGQSYSGPGMGGAGGGMPGAGPGRAGMGARRFGNGRLGMMGGGVYPGKGGRPIELNRGGAPIAPVPGQAGGPAAPQATSAPGGSPQGGSPQAAQPPAPQAPAPQPPPPQPPAPEPPPASAEPEAPPPDDSNEAPSDPQAPPEDGDSSGDAPGSSS